MAMKRRRRYLADGPRDALVNPLLAHVHALREVVQRTAPVQTDPRDALVVPLLAQVHALLEVVQCTDPLQTDPRDALVVALLAHVHAQREVVQRTAPLQTDPRYALVGVTYNFPQTTVKLCTIRDAILTCAQKLT